MISDVYLLAKAMLPKGTEEDDPPFPNCTDADIWVAGFTEGFELAIKNCSSEASEPAFMRIVIEYICQIKNINLNELRKRYSY